MRYWVAVASKEHVLRGVEGGFAQVCHGKVGPLKRMGAGDGLLYYSPTLRFQEKEACQSFTAIGKIKGGEPYPFMMSEDFIPWRIDVTFRPCQDVPIRPLLEKLSFIEDPKRWGFPFRRGCFEIEKRDFLLIEELMEK